MTIYINNNDPFGNNVRVIDKNADDDVIFEGFIGAHVIQPVECRMNDSDFGNIATSEDGKRYIGRSLLKDGDTVIL